MDILSHYVDIIPDNAGLYQAVRVSEPSKEDVLFNTGNFMKDWFRAIKHIVQTQSELHETSVYSITSDINHLSDFGLDVVPKYLACTARTDSWELLESNGLSTYPDGLEFFLFQRYAHWSWEQLKAYCEEED